MTKTKIYTTPQEFNTEITTLKNGLTPFEQEIFSTTIKHIINYRYLISETSNQSDIKKYKSDILRCESILKIIKNREHSDKSKELMYNISVATGIILQGVLKGMVAG